MNYLIEQQSQLDELQPLFAQLHEQAGHVSVDTEFLREKTYSAKLCLVQLGIGDDQYCVDVLAINDLQLLVELFTDQRVVKIFHAARQDLEVLYQTLNIMPKPIFDTQLAAAFAGMDMQLGYSALVAKRLEIELPKSQARTDWTRRPLSEEQLAYAAEDVTHLENLYQLGLDDLSTQNKHDWYDQEIAEYYDVDKYVIKPSRAYLRMYGGGLNIAQQYTLKALAEWREAHAQTRNIPRTWVLKDDRLFDLAARRPQTEEAVLELKVFGKKSARRMAPQVAKLISEVKVGEQRIWERAEPLDKPAKAICSKMMQELAKVAEQQKIAQGLLATRRDVEALYRDRQAGKLLSGWRKSIVGEKLLDFLVLLEN